MERGVWLESGVWSELCVLVRDVVLSQRRLVEWMERYGGAVEGGMNGASSLPMVSQSREVTRAVGYIDRHYGEVIGLTRVARHVGCSRTHLARVFRRETGKTMGEYLKGVRLGRAMRGLREGDKVEAVMLDVGYRSRSNFRRLFKARVGVTPRGFKVGS